MSDFILRKPPRRKPQVLPLAYYGEAILRQKAEAIKEFTPEILGDLLDLAYDMRETINYYKSAGIASNQVFRDIRIFVTCHARNLAQDKDKDASHFPMKVYINPVLVEPTSRKVQAEEGCMSLPGIRVSVERPEGITVKAYNLDGIECIEVFEGWEARMMMHENDHLNGVLAIDRTTDREKKLIDPILRQIKQKVMDKKRSK